MKGYNKKYLTRMLLVALAGLSISILASYGFLRIGMDRAESSFRSDANDRASLIMKSLETDEIALEAVRSYFTGAPQVTIRQFNDQVMPLLERMIGVGAISWIIPHYNSAGGDSNKINYREMFVAQSESKQSQRMNTQVSSPFILSHIHQAVQSRSVVTTPLHTSTVSGKKGFSLFLPVYEYMEGGGEYRVKGLVCGFMAIEDLVEYSLLFLNPVKIDIELYENRKSNEPVLLYHHKSSQAKNISVNAISTITQVDFYQRSLTVVCRPHDEYLSAHISIVHYLILLLGLILTAFIVVYVHLQNMERSKISKLIQLRTQELEASEQFQRRNGFIIEQMFDGLIVTDLQGVIIDWNRGAKRIFGFSKQEAVGNTPSITHNKACAEWLIHDMLEGVKQQGRWIGEVPFVHKDGSVGVCESAVVPFYDDSNVMIATIGVYRNITKRKEVEEKLKYMAHHDSLTLLPNRNLLLDRLKVAIAGAKRYKSIISVMFLDLDGFKKVNDTYGHDAGDVVLKQVAERLRMLVREYDTVARYGGDEFVVALLDQHDRETSLVTADKIISQVSQPYFLNSGITVEVRTSIGISYYPYDGEMPEQLIKKADACMYSAKESGKNCCNATEILASADGGIGMDI